MELKVKAVYDPGFLPMVKYVDEYASDVQKAEHQKIAISVVRNQGYTHTLKMDAFKDGVADERNCKVVERIVKTFLWVYGGYKIIISGSKVIYDAIAKAYAKGGARDFDNGFMSGVYERPFEVQYIENVDDAPESHESANPVGRHLDGCRIGFDAGGSDRKVSAVIDGKTVYSEEVVWHPKTSADPQYQFDGIVTAFQTAASKMPRVDGIGVSSAGTFVGNAPMVSSLFIKVPRERREEVKTIYDRAAKEIGDVPIVVANDGDVTALAGYMSLGTGCVMGLAMGTSEAVGYVDAEGNILGWFNELAFAPVDLNEHAMRDEWSGDLGVGCKYFSQDAVAKLAPAAGIALSEHLTPAEKLKEVQKLAEGGNPYALAIFDSIGVYLAHTLSLYEMFYDIRNLLVLGRVASGIGGERIVSECQRVLNEEYPELSRKLRVMLPDENFRRVGQSMAAASLPDIR